MDIVPREINEGIPINYETVHIIFRFQGQAMLRFSERSVNEFDKLAIAKERGANRRESNDKWTVDVCFKKKKKEKIEMKIGIEGGT